MSDFLVFVQAKLLWIREEALASVVAVEMLDLPVSDMDAAIEKGFDSKESKYYFSLFVVLKNIFIIRERICVKYKTVNRKVRQFLVCYCSLVSS